MDYDMVFQGASMLALAGWAVLILGPRHVSWLNAGVQFGVPLVLAAVYSALIMTHFASAGGGYGSIAEVRALFASDPVLVGGWVHYLAFDLFVGAWLAHRLDKQGVHRGIQAPILASVFMFGPVGFLIGLAIEAGQGLLQRENLA